MSRQHLTFECEGSELVGTLDDGLEATGLLLVSGGNELRAGAWSGQAQFAARIAAEGFPVFRFDRRGVGDSEGGNGEFRTAGPDIAAALAAFRAQCPRMTRVIGLGNCDAASALMLSGGAGLNGLILSNPWTIENENEEAPPEQVRDHYRKRLADPAAFKRLLTGKVSLSQLAGSLISALRPAAPPSSLAQDMASGIAGFAGPIRFLVADNDRTGRAFVSGWQTGDSRIRTCEGASHSFVEPAAREWLFAQVLEALRG